MVDVKKLISDEINKLQETKQIDMATKTAEINGFYNGADRALKVVLAKIVEAEEQEETKEKLETKKNSKEEIL